MGTMTMSVGRQMRCLAIAVAGVFSSGVASAAALVAPNAPIKIEVNGASGGDYEPALTPELCAKDFTLTEDEVRVFFTLSQPRNSDEHDDEFRESPDSAAGYCHVLGTVLLPNGSAARWRIDQDLRGTLSLDGRTKYLICRHCIARDPEGFIVLGFDRRKMGSDLISQHAATFIEKNFEPKDGFWIPGTSPEMCKKISITQDDIREFFQLSVQYDTQGYDVFGAKSEIGRCVATGTVRQHGGPQIRWKMDAEGNGQLLDGESVVDLHCLRCREFLPDSGTPYERWGDSPSSSNDVNETVETN
jgi:hypothetical protein